MQALAQSSPIPYRRQAGESPLPGCRLLEPLGRGGFGEVWKCTVPGGFVKAMKFVPSDRDFASSERGAAELEWVALERIKSIRHPFLLSTERMEIVGKTLVIVMELADRNLLDLYREHHEAGEPGIPRAELLRLLLEAAEALDFLNVRHGLQHLDVKPANLFLVSNHLKVGDFGLVSGMDQHHPYPQWLSAAGMTPLYVAPERLQGGLSQKSDQYSLAVVYQELLTGVLPFQGKNAVQVSLAHLSGEPDLDPLPAGDRPAVARALSRNPDDRFPTCLEFVRALVNATEEGPASGRSGRTTKQVARVSPDTRTLAALQTTPLVPGLTPRIDPLPPKAAVSAPRVNAVHVPNLAAGSIPDHEVIALRSCGPLGEVYQVRSSRGRERLARFISNLPGDAERLQKHLIGRLAALAHPALPASDVYWRGDGRVIVVSDVGPSNLQDRFRECAAEGLTGIPRQELLQCLRPVAQALDELHQQHGLRHLGLHPAKVFFTDDAVQLLDFGLVELVEAAGGEPVGQANSRYLPAEPLRGDVRATADAYSLALIYVEMLTGIQPSPSRANPRPTGQRHRPTLLSLDMLRATDREAVGRALHPDPRKRLTSCLDLINALEEAGNPHRRGQQALGPLPRIISLTEAWTRASEGGAGGARVAEFVREVLAQGAGEPAALQEMQYVRSEEHTSELQSLRHLVCRLLLEKKNAS